MTNLTSNDPASTVAPALRGSEPVWLVQIDQPGREPKIVSLPTGKCTVGSSARCTICVADRQVRPLHCLIVHSPTETVVNRWAPGAQINGQEFAAARLQLGDSLRIGEVELRFVAETDPPSTEPGTYQSQSKIESPKAKPALSPVDTVTTGNDAAVRRLRNASQNGRKRCRKMVAALRQLRDQTGDLDQQIDLLQQQLHAALAEKQQQTVQVSRLQTGLAERESQAVEETDRLIAELTASYENLGEAEATAAEQTTRCESLQVDLRRLQTERDQLVSAQTADQSRQQELEKVVAQHNRRVEELVAEKVDLVRQQKEFDETLAERDRTLKALQEKHESTCSVLQSLEKGAFDQVDQCSRLEEQLAELRDEREQWTKTKTTTAAQLCQLEQTAEQHAAEVAALKEELEAIGQNRTDLQKELSKSYEAFEALEAETTELRSRCEQLSTAHLSSEQQQIELQQMFGEYQHRVEQGEQELRRAGEREKEWGKAVAEQAERNELLRTEAADARRQNEELTSQRDAERKIRENRDRKLSKQDHRVELFEVDLKSLQTDLSYANDQVKRLEDECKGSRQQLKTLHKELEGKDNRESELCDHVEKLSDHRDQLQTALQEAHDRMSAVEPTTGETETPKSSNAPEESINEVENRTKPASPVDFFAAPPAPDDTDSGETAAEFQPTSFVEQYSHLLEEGHDSDNASDDPVLIPAVEQPPKNRSGDDESDDAVLEDYMSNMLARMRGEPSSKVTPPLIRTNTNGDTTHPDPVAAVDAVAKRIASTASEIAEVEPLGLDELRETSQKPELLADLGAMRQLANQSARSAIAKHHRRRHLERALGSFFVCMIATAIGIYALLAVEDYRDAMFTGGCVAVLIGVVGGVRLARLLLLAIREGSWATSSKAKKPIASTKNRSH